MEKETIADEKDGMFLKKLPADFVMPRDGVEERLLREYGSVFVAGGGVTAPGKVVFKDESEVFDFQSGLASKVRKIGGYDMELQAAAMGALTEAVSEAAEKGLSISPRGADSAKRGYAGTVELWESRVEPALEHWLAQGRITQAEAESLRALPPYEQVPEVFKLEAEGIFFAKDLSKSIIYSVAPPGASQHLAMLAFDAMEHAEEGVRAILARHGWYQTVTSDLPHFTFLGVAEEKLGRLGLRSVEHGGRTFWVPDL